MDPCEDFYRACVEMSGLLRAQFMNRPFFRHTPDLIVQAMRRPVKVSDGLLAALPSAAQSTECAVVDERRGVVQPPLGGSVQSGPTG